MKVAHERMCLLFTTRAIWALAESNGTSTYCHHCLEWLTQRIVSCPSAVLAMQPPLPVLLVVTCAHSIFCGWILPEYQLQESHVECGETRLQ